MNSGSAGQDQDIVDRLCKAKGIYRREMAALPFEEKIKIVVELQKIAANANPKRQRRVWEM